MKPISQVENKDCMEAMKGFENKFFDLAIVDPPYGIERFADGIREGDRLHKHGVNCTGIFNNGVPDNEYFSELFRISQNQIIWGANNFLLPKTEYFCIWN